MWALNDRRELEEGDEPALSTGPTPENGLYLKRTACTLTSSLEIVAPVILSPFPN